MQEMQFLGWNIILIGIVVLAVLIYLVVLINKRRKDNFLHKRKPDRR